MRRAPIFIVSLSRVDALTLISLLLAAGGLKASLHGYLSLGIVLMLGAMLADMLDGVLARRWALESEFGRYLDSLCDVLTYLLLPLFLLHQMGLNDTLSLTTLFAYLACGIVRLARFNIVGTVSQGGAEYHLGLQVIWSQLVVVLSFPLFQAVGDSARPWVASVLLVMSLLMIVNVRVRKPTAYRRLAVLMVAVAAIYARLHVIGRHGP